MTFLSLCSRKITVNDVKKKWAGRNFQRLVKVVKPGLGTVNGKVQERGNCILYFYTLEQMEMHANNWWYFKIIGSQAAVARDYKPEFLLNLV